MFISSDNVYHISVNEDRNPEILRREETRRELIRIKQSINNSRKYDDCFRNAFNNCGDGIGIGS